MTELSKILTSRKPEKEIALLFAQCGATRERGDMCRRVMELTGWSRNKVYDLAKRGGWSSGRKARSDKGKWALTRDEVRQLIAMTKKTKRKGLRMTAPAEVALDIAEMNGLIGAKVSPATLCRYMREMGMSKREMRVAMDRGTHTHIATDHPNHEWQVDVTPCNQFYFKGKGLKVDEYYDPINKNKVEVIDRLAKRKKILRYAAIDHYSGAFYVRYFESPGENMRDALEFIIKAMQPKSDPDRYPLRGVPLQICADRGGAFKNFMLANFLDHLECNLYLHEPENPNRKGAVEGFMNIWEMHFESRLKFERIENLGEMNELAEMYCLRLNATKKHTRHGHTRTAFWSTIRNERLRNLPDIEVCRELIHLKPETRVVTPDREISYNGDPYRVADPALIDKKVIVRMNPYVDNEVTVEYEDARYACPLIERDDESGFRVDSVPAVASGDYDDERYAHRVNTPTMEAMNELPKLPPLKGFRRDTDDIAVASLGGRRRGEDVDVGASHAAPREYDNTSARIKLLDILGRESFTAEEVAWIERNWGDTVAADRINETATIFKGEALKPEALSLAPSPQGTHNVPKIIR